MYTEICAELGVAIATASSAQGIQFQLILESPSWKFLHRQVLRLPEKYTHDRSFDNATKGENVDFVSVTESIDTSLPSGELVSQFIGAVGQFERSLMERSFKLLVVTDQVLQVLGLEIDQL
jgi:hypothetical protein